MRGRNLFLRWLILLGLIIFGAFVLLQNGLISLLVSSDSSSISLVILGTFVVSTAYLGRWAWRLAGESDWTRQRIGLDNQQLAASAFKGLVGDLIDRAQRAHHISNDDPGETLSLLTEALNQRLRSPVENGWFIADILFKLGLIGTVIGFIVMLSSVPDIKEIDLATVQAMLETMTSGMRVALFTTVAGIGCGSLLAMQCQILERETDAVIADANELLFRIRSCPPITGDTQD